MSHVFADISTKKFLLQMKIFEIIFYNFDISTEQYFIVIKQNKDRKKKESNSYLKYHGE